MASGKIRRETDAAVRLNQAGIARMAELLELPPALVGVAVAHVAKVLGAPPSSVIATLGLAIDQLKARAVNAAGSGAALAGALPGARKV